MGLPGKRQCWAVAALCLLALVVCASCTREPRLSLQTRIDQAEAGATISIEPGRLIGSLFIAKSIVLEGAGTNAEEIAIVGSVGGVATIEIEGNESVSVEIRNLTILSGVGGVDVSGAAQVVLADVRIVDSLGSGLSLRESATASLVDCTISGSGRNGISVAGGASLDVRGCKIVDSEATGIASATRGTVTLKDSRIVGNGECGVEFRGATQAFFENVAIIENGYAETSRTILEEAARSGLWLAGESDATLRDCKVSSSGGCGVYADEAASLLAVGTEFAWNWWVGIAAFGSVEIEIVECEIRDSRTHGLLSGDGAIIVLRDSEIVHSGEAGVLLMGGSYVDLFGCTLTGNHQGAVTAYSPECLGMEDFDARSVAIGMVGGYGNIIPGPDEALGNTPVATCPEYLKKVLCRETAAIDRTAD